MLRVIVITNLFPNEFEPHRGLFNFYQVEALSKLAEVRVLAPVPTYPGMRVLRGSSGRVGVLPLSSNIDGISVKYPRYPYVPVIGRPVHGRLYHHGVARDALRLIRDFEPQVALATWVYPDGWATARIAHRAGIPAVIKAHGSDVNEALESRMRRRQLEKTLARANRVVAVSQALSTKIESVGIDRERISVVHNGVDGETFAPLERAAARRKLGVQPEAKIVLFVGNLKPVKGLPVLLGAFAGLNTECRLVIVGHGALEARLREMSRHKALDGRVSFQGEREVGEIATWMNAADVLCLPSLHEGVPNVVLEAMSCGTPVVASRTGGIPEVLPDRELGILVPPGDPGALRSALEEALAHKWDRQRIRSHSERFRWDKSAAELFAALESVC